MRVSICAAAALLAGVSLAAPAQAQSTDEKAFGLGQFAGASKFCEVPDDDLNTLMAKLLVGAGVDPTAGGPPMQRFTEGVTDGIKTMQSGTAAPCADVKAKFEEIAAKVK